MRAVLVLSLPLVLLLLPSTSLASRFQYAEKQPRSNSRFMDQDRADRRTQSCQAQTCDLIREEVESLSRLKIIRSYVTETVRLLDSLMESMDDELVKVARKIQESGGDACPNLPSPLDYIAEPMDKEYVSANAGVMEEPSVSGYTSSQRSINDNIEIMGSDDLSSGIEQSTSGFGYDGSLEEDFEASRGTNSNSRWSGQSTGGRGDNRNNHRVTSSTSTTSVQSSYSSQGGWGAENEVESQEENDVDTHSSSNWSRRDHSTSKRGRQLHHSSTFQPIVPPANTGGATVTRTCRGLIDSPHYVPGIHTWCSNNCARGYCPLTHCTCN